MEAELTFGVGNTTSRFTYL